MAVTAPGGPAHLAELPVPRPAGGEVLVKVTAAGLNPLDTLIASGALTGMLLHEYPLVLGRDAAGVVEQVGPGVDGFAPGDEVLGHVPFVAPIRAGTLAEHTVLPASSVAHLPAGLDVVTSAALPLSGAAALVVIRAVAPRPGMVVLVNGASGGVGSFVLQLLRPLGVEVIATGGPNDGARLLALGADTVVDYTAGEVVDQVLGLHPGGVDTLVNLHGMTLDRVPLAAVRVGGAVATTTSAPDAATLAAAGRHGGVVRAAPTTAVLDELTQLVSSGALTVQLEQVVPLEGTLAALALLGSGTASGKLVVTLHPSRGSDTLSS
ncbi:MAG TPA: NADP-dependent oxidoreductase [Candidatus Nanopelagicales bacterium]|nr:NADP-dependent oxidoreductase [Candidatus Nanopelagicales bacterium]